MMRAQARDVIAEPAIGGRRGLPFEQMPPRHQPIQRPRDGVDRHERLVRQERDQERRLARPSSRRSTRLRANSVRTETPRRAFRLVSRTNSSVGSRYGRSPRQRPHDRRARQHRPAEQEEHDDADRHLAAARDCRGSSTGSSGGSTTFAAQPPGTGTFGIRPRQELPEVAADPAMLARRVSAA